jgi:hypothetical protein
MNQVVLTPRGIALMLGAMGPAMKSQLADKLRERAVATGDIDARQTLVEIAADLDLLSKQEVRRG